MVDLLTELHQQPAALRSMLEAYRASGFERVLRLPAAVQPVLLGMGASYHAAWIGSAMLSQAGLPAFALEAADVLLYRQSVLKRANPIIYISQSGSSAEVQPLLETKPAGADLIGITNEESSPLAQGAASSLPLYAGEEHLIAGKTYINTLALLWLLAEHWAGNRLSVDPLLALADRMDNLLRHSENAIERLDDLFNLTQAVIFLGHGPHAATAREASMTLAEWPKLTSLNFGVGAFRHGFIETTGAQTGVVLFAPQGAGQPSTIALGEELASYGAKVLVIENGWLRGIGEKQDSLLPADELLSPALDILPIQLFAEYAARQRLEQVGFRYIRKVVTKL